jgi:hypothetical protein
MQSLEILFPETTRFANLRPATAFLVIIGLIVAIGLGFIFPPPLIIPTDKAGEDLRCYQSILERIHMGEGYYKAAATELRSRGYPTRSVFNWRPPLLAWLMGHLPSLLASRLVAIILSLITIGIWFSLLRNLSFTQVFFGGILLTGFTFYAIVSPVFLMHEFWAGTLITLSLLFYARGWRFLALGSGLFALFLRELSLPFVCVMALISYIEGHRRESFFWILGIIGFTAHLGVHSVIVNNLITEGDLAQKEGWIVFGGWPFILSTVQVHPFLLIAPYWVTVIIFPLSVLGVIGWFGPLGFRLFSIIGIYVLALLFVGKEFNRLWGLMYVNIVPLGLLYVPYSFHDLWGSIRRIHFKTNQIAAPSSANRR